VVLDRYVGRYDFSPNDWITVTRGGDDILIGGSGYPTVPFYPQSEVSFFAKAFDERIVFKIDGKGRPTEVVSTSSGETKRYRRVQ
jgi:hypothetical protein